MNKPYSIRRRLLLTMSGILILCNVLLYIAAFAYGRSIADRSYDRLLTGSALSIADMLTVSDAGVDVDIPYAALDMLSVAPDDRIFYRVFLPNGKTITGYPDLPLPAEMAKQGLFAPTRRSVDFAAPYRGEQTNFVLLTRSIERLDRRVDILVQVGQTRRARNELASEQALLALLPIALLGLLALTAVWLAILLAVRPLKAIGEELVARGPGELQPVEAPVPAEMTLLVGAIDRFMSRLHGNMDALRAFAGDAAHQVRTPLAALRAQAQSAIEGSGDEMRSALHAVERNAAVLTRVLNQMLTDATLHHRAELQHDEAFDLADIIHEAIDQVVPRGLEGRLKLQGVDKEMPMRGDPLMLGEAFKNLIGNAFQHGEAADKGVDILAGSDGGICQIDIVDHGPGIANEDVGRIFRRFERGRSSASGAGLGLGIARQAIEGHGGTVEIVGSEEPGLAIRVRLPTQFVRQGLGS